MLNSDFNEPGPSDKQADIAVSDQIALNATLKQVLQHDIATMNRKVGNMDLKKIRRRYGWFRYDSKHDIETIRKNLRRCLSEIMIKNVEIIYKNENLVDYYVVVDFEATCEVENPENYHHEIIEFPAVLVNSRTLEIEDTFRSICQPGIKKKISDFCVDLTGISQKDVDNAEPFTRVLQFFQNWLLKHGLGVDKDFVIVTDGPWDACRFLFVQCVLSKTDFPRWAEKWVDLRRIFRKFYNVEKSFLKHMLEYLQMSFEGRPHCGIDDAKNIARVLLRLIVDGAVILPNTKILADKKLREIARLTDFTNKSLEADHEIIPWTEKPPTHRDIKITRSMKIHALTKLLSNADYDFETILSNVQHDFGKLSFRHSTHKKKKGKKKKRNF